MIGQVTALQPIIFTQDALAGVKTPHVEPLYITATKDDYEIHKVLIDGGAGLNALWRRPRFVGIDPASLEPSEISVRAYDDAKRDVLGTTDDKNPRGVSELVEFVVLPVVVQP
ncbi:hypothetical protein AAC387_Pa01g2265 [Persea americana]